MAVPLPDLPTAIGVTIFCVAMAAASYHRRVFNLSGSISAFFVGMITGIGRISRITVVNRAFCRMFGSSEAQLLGSEAAALLGLQAGPE